MIPMILIVGTVDIFFNFMQCPLHPEYSAPCSIIRINTVGYGFFLIITIIFAIFSARKLKEIKKKIENDFFEVTNHAENKPEDKLDEPEKIEEKFEEIKEVKAIKPKKIIVKSDSKKPTKKVVKNETKKEKKKTIKSPIKKESTTKKKSSKK
jgi:ABC-type lipoprotein release transport system permease subunit